MKTKLLKALRGAWKAGLILTVVLCAAIFCGCAGEVVDTAASTRENDPGEGGPVHELGTFEGLPAETEKRILQEYFDAYIKSYPRESDFMTVNDIWVGEYYGTYNDCVVFNIHGLPYLTVERYVETVIADIKFRYAYNRKPTLWKDGQFYGHVTMYQDLASGGAMREAYDLGLLTEDDLRSIAGYLNYKEDSGPTESPGHKLGTLDGLSAEMEKKILQDYFDAFIKPDFADLTVNDVWVAEYYGTYNECVVVNIQYLFALYPDVMRQGTLAGIQFFYTASRAPLMWKDGQFYALHEAYDLSFLTVDNLRSIAGYLNYEE